MASSNRNGGRCRPKRPRHFGMHSDGQRPPLRANRAKKAWPQISPPERKVLLKGMLPPPPCVERGHKLPDGLGEFGNSCDRGQYQGIPGTIVSKSKAPAATLQRGLSVSCGDPGRIRTLNLLIRSEVLYPVELQSRLNVPKKGRKCTHKSDHPNPEVHPLHYPAVFSCNSYESSIAICLCLLDADGRRVGGICRG